MVGLNLCNEFKSMLVSLLSSSRMKNRGLGFFFSLRDCMKIRVELILEGLME